MAFACASCHLASGMGTPNRQPGWLSGILHQHEMMDFISGARTNHVIAGASAINDPSCTWLTLPRHGHTGTSLPQAITTRRSSLWPLGDGQGIGDRAKILR